MSDEILFADTILHALNDNNKAKISELIEFTGFTEENVRKTVDYLARRKYIIRCFYINSEIFLDFNEKWWGRSDLNARPPGPKPGIIPS